MSVFARVLQFPLPPSQPESGPEQDVRRRSAPWFAWWLAACLVVVAHQSYRQLEIQNAIRTESRVLEATVGRATVVSAATNQQLAKVREVDAGTGELLAKLEMVSANNARLRLQLTELESTVELMAQSIGTLDAQAAESGRLLAEIVALSGALQSQMARMQSMGDNMEANLDKMLDLQEYITADLAELNRKTKVIERLMGGE